VGEIRIIMAIAVSISINGWGYYYASAITTITIIRCWNRNRKYDPGSKICPVRKSKTYPASERLRITGSCNQCTGYE
jgi:hypothetical protein